VTQTDTLPSISQVVPLRGDSSIRSDSVDANAVTGAILVGRDCTELVNAEKRLGQEREAKTKAEASELAAKEANRLKCVFLLLRLSLPALLSAPSYLPRN
jgi:hypothetical protein